MTKHIGGAESAEALEKLINSAEERSTIFLDCDLYFDLGDGGSMKEGGDGSEAAISIDRRDITIDGQGHAVTFRCAGEDGRDADLIRIRREASGAEIKNLGIECIYEGGNSRRRVTAVHNSAYGVRLTHCKLTMVSETQVSFFAVSNDRGTGETFGREGDSFVADGNEIRIRSNPAVYDYATDCCGIYNGVSFGATFTNNYIYVMANGAGEEQKSFGIFNRGRSVRIVNNGIEANGYHIEGTGERHTYVFGVRNEGDYLLFSANDCISEWAGKAVGLMNKGAYCTFTGNKFTAAHTLYGICVENQGDFCNFSGNIIHSTSRNPRLVYNEADHVNYSSNMLQSFYDGDCQSGCGMVFVRSAGCYVSGNQIFGVKNCGIFSRTSDIVSRENTIEFQKSDRVFRALASEHDADVFFALNENRILSEE